MHLKVTNTRNRRDNICTYFLGASLLAFISKVNTLKKNYASTMHLYVIIMVLIIPLSRKKRHIYGERIRLLSTPEQTETAPTGSEWGSECVDRSGIQGANSLSHHPMITAVDTRSDMRSTSCFIAKAVTILGPFPFKFQIKCCIKFNVHGMS